MKKILWGIALLLLLPLLALIAINAFDEKLDPKAAAWGEPRPVTVAEGDNGYYALIALGAPDGADSMAYARAWVGEARAAAKENRNEKQPAVTRAQRPELCNPAHMSCLAAAREKKTELTTALEAHKEDLARYQTLITARRYEDVLDYPLRVNSSLPAFADAARAQRAWLTQAALAAEAGNLEDAVAAVERDLAYYRVMLGGARTLIGKMLASRGYWTGLAFLSDLLQQKSSAMEPFVPRLRELLKAIDSSALTVDAAMETEFGVMKQLLGNPEATADFGRDAGLLGRVGIKLFYKPNATINHVYTRFSDMAAALNQPVPAIDAAWRKASASAGQLSTWDYINNPLGNILLNIAIPSYRQYALRLHDLDAFNRLVALRVEALAANIGAEQAAEFAAKSEARLHDPYTDKPMLWDAAKKRFQFKPQSVTAQQYGFNVDAGGAYVAY